ncbi:MAG TPA: thiamine pyrophosphate-dependent enzyme, partial [Actinomycetota bacterium]|nr:thiamine pyrophosphate-dependent enzyme [Actinomycetota bacterium]
ERFKRTFAADLETPDFVALAKAFGVRAQTSTVKDVGEAISSSFKQKGPTLIEMRARFAPPLTTSPRWPLKGKKEVRP